MPELILNSFKRVNEFADAEFLSPDELSRLKNMVLDAKGGKLVKRGGFIRYNSNDAKSAIGEGILAMFEAVTDSNYLLAQIGTKLRKSLDGTGTWSDVKTGLTENYKLKKAVYDQKYYFTNNQDAIFLTDLTSNWNLEIDAPAVSGIGIATSSNGSLDDSQNYRWILVYVTESGELSNISKPFTYLTGAVDIATTDSTNKTIDFTNLPVSPDTRVVSKRLYRTEGGGSTYYLIATLDNDTTSYSDNNADSRLQLDQGIQIITTPTKAGSICVHKDRLILANITTKEISGLFPPAHSQAWVLSNFTVGSSGNIEDGQHSYKYSFVNEEGIETQLSEAVNVTIDTGGTNTGSVILAGFSRPRIGAGNLDNTTIAIRFYRTEAGGSIYKFLKDLSVLDATSTTDTTADASLGAAYPKSGKGSETEISNNSRIYFSEIGKPSEINALYFFDIFPDDGDEIVEIMSYKESVLIFKQNSICVLSTIGSPYNWEVQKLFDNIGSDTADSISKDGDLIYFVKNNQLFRFPDQMKVPISLLKQESFKGITSVKDSCFLTSKRWYCLLIEAGTYERKILVFDTKIESWYEFDINSYGDQWLSLLEKKLGTDDGLLLIGTGQEGYIKQYSADAEEDFSENEFVLDELGENLTDELGNYIVTEQSQTLIEIYSYFSTKVFTINDSISLVRLREFLMNVRKRDGQPITVTIENPDESLNRVYTLTTDSENSSKYATYREVTDSMTGSLKIANKIKFIFSGAGLLEFSGLKLIYRLISRGKRARY